MSIFKKSVNKPEPKSSVPLISYPISVVYWNDHYDDIQNLFNEANINLNDLKVSGYLRCKVVPEIENENDPNALKVYGAIKGGKTFYPIGYVPADIAPDLRPDVKKAVSGSHYWSLRYYFDVRHGLEFNLSLKESKFPK